MGLKLLSGKETVKADAADRTAVLKHAYESDSTVEQQINIATGWLLESTFTNSIKINDKLLLDIVRLKLIEPIGKK